MVNKKKLFPLLAAVSILLLSSCVSVNTGDGGGAGTGGVFKSDKSGDTWTAKNLIPTVSGRPKSFSSVDILSLAMDPNDEKTLYAGSLENGLMYTYDGGNTWSLASSLGQVTVNAIAVDPLDKCTVYIATGNKVIKTEDCSRTWTPIYFDNDLREIVKTIAIDHYDNRIVYIGITRGDIIKSLDGGSSWKSINRFEDDVEEIIVSPHDSRVLFVGTKNAGIFRTLNGGSTWADLTDSLKQAAPGASLAFRDMTMTTAKNGAIFVATRYGLFESDNNGDTWRTIELITPEKDATINSLAIAPDDANKIFYVTNTTFYRSVDGGENWSTKRMPTTRAGWKLLIDQKNSDIIYLGVKTVGK